VRHNIPVGLGTEGNQFDEGKWQYNLKPSNYFVRGTYTISIVPGDNYVIDPGSEASFAIEQKQLRDANSPGATRSAIGPGSPDRNSLRGESCGRGPVL
jgi:hypothetical protein